MKLHRHTWRHTTQPVRQLLQSPTGQSIRANTHGPLCIVLPLMITWGTSHVTTHSPSSHHITLVRDEDVDGWLRGEELALILLSGAVN